MSPDPQIAGAASAVREFFDRVLLASMELPDEWFGGRSGENLHELPSFRRDHIGSCWSSGLLLSISGRPEIAVHDSELGLSDFDQLVFDW